MNQLRYYIWMIIFIGLASIASAGTISREYLKLFDFRGDRIDIENINGEIVLETWNRDQVEVSADISVRAGDKAQAKRYLENIEIVVRQRGNELSIRVDLPTSQGGGFMDWVFGAGKPQASVDFWIKAPRETDIRASSVNGSIEAVGLDGHANLSTTNGKVVAENMRGTVDAGTTNGGIYVEIDQPRLRNDMKFHTVNGSIKLYIPQNVRADVDISTVNGNIHTDFPLQVEGKWGPKNVHGEINGGGRRIDLSTVNGSVSLLER